MQILEHAGDVATEKKNFRQLPTSKLHLSHSLYSPLSSITATNTSHLSMEKASTKSALKFVKTASQSASQWSSTNSSGMTKDELRDMFYDKTKASRKSPPKENTKPQEFKLHTQERAVKRAMFNYAVTTKFYLTELQKKHEEKLQKMIEEEEIRLLRKEMIPRAQLMPYFDRPFFPQRSSRTVPRESCLHMMSSKCWRCTSGNEFYNLHHCGHQALKPIK